MNKKQRMFFILLLWQVASLLLTFESVFSELISDAGINAPTFQSFWLYLSLSIVYGLKLCYCRSGPDLDSESQKSLWNEWKWYVFAGICDVESNYLIVLAFQYTSIVSVQLLDCFAIPCIMSFSLLVKHKKFSIAQYLGAVLCLAGLVSLIIVDWKLNGDDSKASNPVLGDSLALIGTAGYAISNLLQEHFSQKSQTSFSQSDLYMFRMGSIAALISVVQFIALEEYKQFIGVSQEDGWKIALYFTGYAVCAFLEYSIALRLLRISSATVMNLSYLTSDFFSFIAGAVLFSISFQPLFIASFVAIVVGIAIYHVQDLKKPSLEEETLLGSSKDEE